jgi:hypothetical protein
MNNTVIDRKVADFNASIRLSHLPYSVGGKRSGTGKQSAIPD